MVCRSPAAPLVSGYFPDNPDMGSVCLFLGSDHVSFAKKRVSYRVSNARFSLFLRCRGSVSVTMLTGVNWEGKSHAQTCQRTWLRAETRESNFTA